MPGEDWGGLRAIIDEAAEDARREASEPPVACPHDGDVLQVRSDGVRGCPFCGYRWPS